MPQNNYLTLTDMTAYGHLTNLELKKAFYSSKAKTKSVTQHGTVILAKVIEGPIIQGEKITLQGVDGKKIIDQVVRIEIEKQEVKSANKGAEVGICLLKSKISDFEQLLN